MAKNKHPVHKYQKVAVGKKGYQVYKCVLEGCNHHLPTLSLALGRETLCHNCNLPTTFTKEMLVSGREVSKPMCLACRELRHTLRAELAGIGDEDA